MAAKPYRITDRRSSFGYASTDNLIESATQNNSRQTVSQLNYDTHRNISRTGRRTLVSLGRWLFANFPTVQGVIREQADMAIATYVPQYAGRNKRWGVKAEEWLNNWHERMIVSGLDYYDFCNILIMAAMVDGDLGLLLSETTDEYPQVQLIPCHRIGIYAATDTVISGRWKGRRIVDGVIINDYSRPIAYEVGESDYFSQSTRYISANDMMLANYPDYCDQYRGISMLASGLLDWKDVAERRRFELIAQKAGAALTLVISNESGEADPSKNLVKNIGTFKDDENDVANNAVDEFAKLGFDGGMVHYLKAGSAENIKSFQNDRPAKSAMEHEDVIVQAALHGVGWSRDYSLNPAKVGGAPMRVVVERINRTLKKRRRLAAKVMKRLDSFGIAKAMALGILDPDVDWYKWNYQHPGDITADKKYDNDVAMSRLNRGLTSEKREAAKLGADELEILDEKIAYEKELQRRCKKAGVEPGAIRQLTPNGNAPAETGANSAPPPDKPEDNNDDDDNKDKADE